MKVVKILNNNVVVVLNKQNDEVILMGNGLGFQKKPGMSIDPNKIEKVFELKSQEEVEQLEKLFSEIPEEIIKISYKIIANAQKVMNKELNPSSFLAIADHLHAAIQRNKKNIQLKNFLLWDIKRFFPTQLEIAKEAIRMVNNHMKVELSDDEAGFLALHITNAEIDSNYEDAVSLTQLIEEILTVIKYTLRINFNESEVYFQRFITHLKFFSERVLKANLINDPENKIESELFVLIKNQYPAAFEATKKVDELLQARRSYVMSKDEQIYITIHLARIIEKVSN